MSEELFIRVNFGKPMPLFPLSTTALMPHQVLPLRVFEPRYKQMLQQALDGPGQIVMATFDGSRWMQEHNARPPIRPAVCVGHIDEHLRLPDGTYMVRLRGICRARILKEFPPTEETLYRRALLEPVGVDQPDEAALAHYRHEFRDALSTEPLNKLRNAGQIVEYLQSDEVPSSLMIEMLGLTFLTESEQRYALLEIGDPERRAQIITKHLGELGKVLRKALPQLLAKSNLPKGIHLN